MANTKTTPGTAFQGPDGQVALKMGPKVAAGQFFVIHPDHGGHYSDDAEVDTIKDWPQLKADAALDAEKVEAGIVSPDQLPSEKK